MKTLTQSKTLIELIKITKDWKKKPCIHQFNLLDELHANENAHTRILVRLLQIPSLLRSFLEYIRDTFKLQSFYIPDELSANDVSEFSDFIDAKIETKNFCIIIENKINYAVDQDRQIERYVSTVKSQNKNIFVLYLTLNGTKIPTPNSIGKSAVPIIEINYREHILNWLEHKITFSVSDTLQQPFLQSGILQYIDHIKGRLGMRKNDYDTLLNDITGCLAEADIFDVIAGLQYLRAYWRIYFTRNIPQDSWNQLPDELKTEVLFELCQQFFAIIKTTDNQNCFLYEGEVFALKAISASKVSLMQIDIHYSGNKNGVEAYENKIKEIKDKLQLAHYMEFEYNGTICLRVAINTATELKKLFELLSLDAKYNFQFNFVENEDILNNIKDYRILSELEENLTALGSQREGCDGEKSLDVENGIITKSYSYNDGRAIQLTQKAWKQPYAIDIWSKNNGAFLVEVIQALNAKNKIYPYSCRWWNGKFYLHFPLLSLDDEYTQDLSKMLYSIYQKGVLE